MFNIAKSSQEIIMDTEPNFYIVLDEETVEILLDDLISTGG